MRRFWSQVDLGESPNGWQILLDGRPVKTPMKAALTLPGRRLAEAVAAEWQAVSDAVDPARMPLTRSANTAIDRVGQERAAMAEHAAAFIEGELLCYRADHPEDLRARQAAAWDAHLAWAEGRLGHAFTQTVGIMPVAQAPDLVRAARAHAGALAPFQLTGFLQACELTRSFVLALALSQARLDAAEAHALAHLDEMFQAEHWGWDAEAKTRLDAIAKDLADTQRFLGLANEAR
ncbi:MAG: ATP12 family chaperone protein [Rhodothalassiaceae bacterium]